MKALQQPTVAIAFAVCSPVVLLILAKAKMLLPQLPPTARASMMACAHPVATWIWLLCWTDLAASELKGLSTSLRLPKTLVAPYLHHGPHFEVKMMQ
jgi:hypothetical protein